MFRSGDHPRCLPVTLLGLARRSMMKAPMNLGFSEMAFIFILALIIFGPKKLPEIGRQIGKFMAEFKRASNEFKWQLEAEMRQIEAEATRERLTKETKQADQA